MLAERAGQSHPGLRPQVAGPVARPGVVGRGAAQSRRLSLSHGASEAPDQVWGRPDTGVPGAGRLPQTLVSCSLGAAPHGPRGGGTLSVTVLGEGPGKEACHLHRCPLPGHSRQRRVLCAGSCFSQVENRFPPLSL